MIERRSLDSEISCLYSSQMRQYEVQRATRRATVVAISRETTPNSNDNASMLEPKVDWDGSGMNMVWCRAGWEMKVKEKRSDVSHCLKVPL